MSAFAILILILALLLVVFTLQNTILITLQVFFWEVTDVPLVLALIVCIIAGFLLAFFLYYPASWKMKKKLKRLQKELETIKATSPSLETSSGEDLDLGEDEEPEKGFFRE